MSERHKCKKHKYKTKLDCLIAIYKSSHHRTQIKKPVEHYIKRFYYCNQCGCYHITSMLKSDYKKSQHESDDSNETEVDNA